MRIVSLVPSASEIICDLGLEQYLVGVSHECNYPLSLDKIDSVTLSNIDSSKTQIEIDNSVRKKVEKNVGNFKKAQNGRFRETSLHPRDLLEALIRNMGA